MPDNTPHQPTDKTRTEVSALKSFGHTHDEIAVYLNISDDTLVKYYKRELDTACIKANSVVANKLYQKATKQEDLTAMIFWLKTRARWKEVKDETSRDTLIEKLLDKLK